MVERISISGTVEKLVYGGSGLIRHSSLVIFVRGVLPKEEVLVQITKRKAHYAEGRLISILKPSQDRVPPKCPHFGTCGGCQLQHASPCSHAPLKRSFLDEAFHAIPHPPIDVLATDDVWAWRRKITLHVKQGELGFLGNDNATLIPIQDCPIFFRPNEMNTIVALKILARTIVDHADIACFRLPSNNLAITVQSQKNVPKCIVRQLAAVPAMEAFAIQCPSWNYSEGVHEFAFEALGAKWHFSIDAFVQNHLSQSERVWQTVIDRVTEGGGRMNILDLYSGIGVTAILLARRGHTVTAVEYSKKAVLAAKKSAAHVPINLLWSKVETAIPKLCCDYDWWIINPPRSGLSDQALQLVINRNPKNILYVSCSPATLARDCHALKAGWNIIWGKAFDLFPQTTHFETIVHLSRNSSF